MNAVRIIALAGSYSLHGVIRSAIAAPAAPSGEEGAAATFSTPHAANNRNAAYPPRSDVGSRSATMSMLWTDAPEGGRTE